MYHIDMDTQRLTSSQRELLHRFWRADFGEGDFSHREHVRISWIYLQCLPTEAALREFVHDLKRLVAALGAESKYHETITWAFLLLIRERVERQEDAADWNRFEAENADLFERGGALLNRYYRSETLGSDLARRVFLMPDRASMESRAA